MLYKLLKVHLIQKLKPTGEKMSLLRRKDFVMGWQIGTVVVDRMSGWR